ncbi:DNA-3-methyladenine glycosylase [Lysinibacter cavernae]|uniref:Putative 3-methyladenine DNA glycosylase n=1 Tax=Lysinibacter cavernae TaxID=1640652 RepID=A0A7X5TU04_9MICO|nr:DNA-3-methyladenine glycosylase [Lysinibacter cavernae]
MSRREQDAGAERVVNADRHRHIGVDREFFERDALVVAPQLLGAFVTTRIQGQGTVTARITEVEAYHGLGTGSRPDPGSHARMGQTPRNRVMFGEPGHVYVYQSYGIHSAANLVCSPAGMASGVLLRAAEIVDGIEIARARRIPGAAPRDLARGPGRLAQALGLFHHIHNGTDAIAGDIVSVRLDPAYVTNAGGAVASGPRVGVSGTAGSFEYPWRFWIAGDPTVSSYRPGKNVPKGPGSPRS